MIRPTHLTRVAVFVLGGLAYGSEPAGHLPVGIDYSKCSEFLEPRYDDPDRQTARGYSWLRLGAFVASRYHYYPFELTEQGAITPKDLNGVEYSRDIIDGRITVRFDYPTPSLFNLSFTSLDDIEEKPDRDRMAFVTITEGDNSVEIIEDLNWSTEERRVEAYGAIQNRDFIPAKTRTILVWCLE